MECKESHSLEHQAGSIIQSQAVGLRIGRADDVTPTPRPKASELLGLKAGGPEALRHSRRCESPISLSLFQSGSFQAHFLNLHKNHTGWLSHFPCLFVLCEPSVDWIGFDCIEWCPSTLGRQAFFLSLLILFQKHSHRHIQKYCFTNYLGIPLAQWSWHKILTITGPCSSSWLYQSFIPFYCWIILNCMDTPLLFTHSSTLRLFPFWGYYG